MKKEIILRPYQEKAVQQCRDSIRQGKNKIILCSPTGSGKTFMFSYMAKLTLERGKKVLICTDRIELMTQTGGSLKALGVTPIEIRAGYYPDLTGALYVAMIETISRRMKKEEYKDKALLKEFDLIIFDEAHKQNFNKLFEFIPDSTPIIGATATPYRSGDQESLHLKYNALINVVEINELIEGGFLSRPDSYGIKLINLKEVRKVRGEYDQSALGDMYTKNKVYQGVEHNYRKYANGKKNLIFCPSINSSETLNMHLNGSGINSKHLDSTMSKKERNSIIDWFKNTDGVTLCNVGILTTGFDCPSVECITLYRATTSLPLFLQMVGRGSRVIPGVKDSFTILDFGENINDRFGYWEAPRPWSLEKKKKRSGVAPVKNCPECHYICFASARECPECGEVFQKQIEEDEFAELKKLKGWQIREKVDFSDLEEVARLAKAKVVKPVWVLHQLDTREEANRFRELVGFKPGWMYYAEKNFPNLKWLN